MTSIIFKVYGMARPGIEPWSSGPLKPERSVISSIKSHITTIIIIMSCRQYRNQTTQTRRSLHITMCLGSKNLYNWQNGLPRQNQRHQNNTPICDSSHNGCWIPLLHYQTQQGAFNFRETLEQVNNKNIDVITESMQHILILHNFNFNDQHFIQTKGLPTVTFLRSHHQMPDMV